MRKIFLLPIALVLTLSILFLVVRGFRENDGIQENFDRFDENAFIISNKTLGKTSLKTENVEVKNGMLKIKLPAERLEGGELATKEFFSHGNYEIRMKLPLAPSSITGFFLYAPPDFFNEIDIEVINSREGKFLLTTYANGKVQNEATEYLGFDPTADFHTYGFEYTKDRVRFYVDQQLIKEFKEEFQREPMQLMVNVWYPAWLDGEPVADKQTLLIDWIRCEEE